MTEVANYPLKSMAENTIPTPEATVLEVLQLLHSCQTALPSEIETRVHGIREKCKQAEKDEQLDGGGTTVNWRRSASHHGSGGHSSSKTNSHWADVPGA